MGVQQRKIEAKRDRRRRAAPAAGQADWRKCDGEWLTFVLSNLAQQGMALRLGYTRDGGAYAIGIYGDGEPFTEYVRPSEDITEYIKSLLNDYGDDPGRADGVTTQPPAGER